MPLNCLQARAAADPRLELVYGGYNLLYRLRTGANQSFWLDWSYQAGDAEWLAYPRASGNGAALEGFVDGNWRPILPGSGA